MAAFVKFDSFAAAVAHKIHDLGSDVLRVMLTNISPTRANKAKADLKEIRDGNGYPAGGLQTAQRSSSQTDGTYRLVLRDVSFKATGGTIGPFRFAVVYNDSAANKELIGFADYSEPSTLKDGETFDVEMNSINGLLSIQ